MDTLLGLLEHLGNFRVLDFRGNQLQTPDKCRMHVIHKLRTLTFLNDSGVSVLDRKKAERFFEKGPEGLQEVEQEHLREKRRAHREYLAEVAEARERGRNSNGRRLQ